MQSQIPHSDDKECEKNELKNQCLKIVQHSLEVFKLRIF